MWIYHTHVLLCKNFLQGVEKQQQFTESPSNLPNANDGKGTAVPTDTDVDCG